MIFHFLFESLVPEKILRKDKSISGVWRDTCQNGHAVLPECYKNVHFHDKMKEKYHIMRNFDILCLS